MIFYLHFNIYLVIFSSVFLGYFHSKHFICSHLSYHLYPIYRILFLWKNLYVIYRDHQSCLWSLWSPRVIIFLYFEYCGYPSCVEVIVEKFDFVGIPLNVEVIEIVVWLCAYPSSVRWLLLCDLVPYPSSERWLLLYLISCVEVVFVGERSCVLLSCICQILSRDSLCGKSCVDV